MTVVLSGFIGFLAYLVLAGSTSPSELVTGAVLGLATAGWTALGRRIPAHRFAFSTGDARAWGRAVRQLPRQTLVAARFLLDAALRPAATRGRAEVRPFDHGAMDDPAARGRRATAVLAASLAPASYVVRIDPERDGALLHAAGAMPETDPRWLT